MRYLGLVTADPSKSRFDRSLLLRVAGIGIVAGLFAGMFGVGGGLIIVPALITILGLDQRLAHGVSLSALVPIAIASTIAYWRAGNIDWIIVGWMTLGAVLGALLGTAALQRLPRRPLVLIFCGVAALSIVRLISFDDPRHAATITVATAIALVAVGMTAGILAGLIGVGGGVIMVPALIVGFGVAPVLAKGISVAVIVPTAIIGTIRNLRYDNTDLGIAVGIGAFGIASAVVGAAIANALSPLVSNLLFAGLLAVVIVQQLLSLRAPRAGVS